MQLSLRNLTKRKQKDSGRNNSGIITVKHRGGGSKRRLKCIDFCYNLANADGVVLGYEYDSKKTRNCPLILVYHKRMGVYSYMLATDRLKTWDFVELKRHKYKKYKSNGSVFKLKYLPVNVRIFNIEAYESQGGTYSRSAGTYGRIMKHYLSNRGVRIVHIELPSDESYYVSGECAATIGQAANIKHKHRKYLKAGRMRWLGCRPRVRGVAMNPVDHPHGGGEGKTSGGRISVSAWGIKTKGVKTGSKRKEIDKCMYTRRYNRGLI